MPGEVVPFRREVDFLQRRVEEIETQLRDMGTLSSLSPLDSLKELTAAIDPSLDLQIDSMNIAHSRVSFNGSVIDYPAVGTLSQILKDRKDRFCDVKVDPAARTFGTSSRVKFTAEIRLCD